MIFIISDIKKVKETKRHFEKISDDMDNALVKNAQAQRSRPQDCEDANNVLTAMRSCFGHTSLDYVYQVRSQVNSIIVGCLLATLTMIGSREPKPGQVLNPVPGF